MPIIDGFISEAQSSKNEPCQLAVDGNSISLVYAGQKEPANFSIKELKFDPPLGSLNRKIKFPDGRIFETADHQGVDQLKNGGFWQRVWKAETFGWHLLPLAIATPILAFGMYRLVMPLLISAGMAVTPDQALYAMDRSSMESIDFTVTNPSEISHDRRVEIQKIFKNLLEARPKNYPGTDPDRIYKYKLHFRSSNFMGPNAFALPGGTIVITDDLIQEFSDDHVIAAVLAHEIGHVEQEHSLRQLYRALGMAAMVTVIAGDAGPMLEDMLWEGSAVLSLSFSRENEIQSDDYSYRTLKAAGLPTNGLIDFFEQIEEKFPSSEQGEWRMTHPIGDKRIANIREKIEADSTTSKDPEN